MRTAYATRKRSALGLKTNATCVSDQGRFTNVAASTFLKETAIATATNSMRWACVAVHAKPTWMATVCAMWTRSSGAQTRVHATLNRERLKKMVLVQKSTNVGSAEERALPLASAIVTATFWTNVAFVAVKELSLARAIATATCLTNVAFVVAMGAIVLAAWKKVRATTTRMCCSRMGHANT